MGQPIDEASVLIVPDATQFGAMLRREVDEAMRGVAREVDRALSGVERSAAEAGMAIGRDFQRGGEQAETALREVSATSRREMAEVAVAADTAGASISSKLGGALALVKGMLVTVGIAAAAGLAALTGFGLKSAASLEQSTVAFTSLLGSAEQAKTFLADLQQFAATTPFEFGDVVGASQRLLVLTKSLGQTKDAVVPLLTTIGNLVSVTGGSSENIDSVVRALSQMASKGKISQEEIMQLAEALPGFNANAAIAASLGMSVADTLKAITAGEVDATTGINALLAGMEKFPGAAGAMAAQSQTLTGVFSTFKDTIGIALTGAFQPVIPAIKSALSDLTPVLGEAIGELAPALGGALSALLPLLGQIVKAIVPILTPLLKALGPVVEALGPALQPLGEALGQILVALSPILPILAEFIGVIAQLAVPVLMLLALILKPLTPILQFMADAIGELGKALGMIDWGAVGQAIGGAFVDAWHAVSDFVSKSIEGWKMIVAFIGGKLVEFKDNVVGAFNFVVDVIKGLPGRALGLLANIGTILVDSGRNLIMGLWNGILGAGQFLWDKISGFVSANIIAPFKAALKIGSPSKLFEDEVGEMIPAGIGRGIEGGLGDISSLISPIVPTGGSASGQGAAMAGLSFGGISVNVNFVGVVPTADEARRAGEQAGDGIMAAIARRNIGLSARLGVAS